MPLQELREWEVDTGIVSRLEEIAETENKQYRN